jgi:trans-L-3-hydroxyproline dehydratase
MSARQAITIETVEMHTGGEPVRIVTAGYPAIPGATILDKRRHAKEQLDHLRRMLIFEPRGHYDMYGVIPVEPDRPEAQLAVLFMHNEGYSTMCGHATIALGRFAIDHGIVAARAPETRFTLQCPCGLVQLRVEVADGPGGLRTGAAAFESVPAFAYALDREIEVPGAGRIRVDIGYGGAFYALVPAAVFGLDIRKSKVSALVEAGDRVTQAAKAQIKVEHPEHADLAFIYGTILTDGRDAYEEAATANLCIFADREVDRSPTGSGVTARIAVQLAKGQIGLGQTRRFESVTGAVFTGRAVRHCRAGRFEAAVVEVGGRAHYTGTARFTLEPDDILGGGFLLR